MALKTFNPTTPSQPPAGHRRPLGPLQGQAGQGADRRSDQERAVATIRSHHRPLHRRRSQAHLPHHRLQASQVRRRRHGRAARIRSEPHRLHRADQVRGRRAGLHHRAAASGCRRQGRRSAKAVDVKPGNAMPLAAHAGRHDRPQRRDEAGQGRPDRPFGRRLRAVCRPRPGHGDPAPQLGRAASRPRLLPGHRSAPCRTRTTATSTTARPVVPSGAASVRTTAASP